MGQWVGSRNYNRLFRDELLWRALWNTLAMSGSVLLVELIIVIGLALLISNTDWVTPCRIIFLLPILYMPSVVEFMWKLAFFPGESIINYSLK